MPTIPDLDLARKPKLTLDRAGETERGSTNVVAMLLEALRRPGDYHRSERNGELFVTPKALDRAER